MALCLLPPNIRSIVMMLILSSMVMVVSAAAAAAPSRSAPGEMEMEELVSPLYPRFMFGSPPRLAARQAIIKCPVGESSCLAINATGCCPNDNYCYVNPQGEPKCCAAGSRCDDPCPISAYRCTVSSTTSCCDRACPAPSAHQCPQSVGGGCCSVNSVCLFGNSCSKTINPATVNTVTPSPTGCTSNQFSCPASVGGGCCISGQTCTAVGTQLLCVANGGSTTARPTTGGGGALDTRTGSALSNAGGLLPTAPTSPSPAATPKSGLSSGAKAGIGVGIPLAVLSTLILLFFLIRRRRLRRQHLKNKAHSPPIRSTTAVNHSSASTPGTHPQGPSSTDYIGALPQPGPFTSTAQAMGMHDASNRGAVPLSPQSPGDITTPVEMAESQATSPASPPAGVGGTPRSGGGRGGDYFAGQVPRSSPAPVASPIQGQLPGQVPLVRELRALERPVELQDTSVKKS